MSNKKPNILILHSDQHSAKTLGCYGNQQVISPHLDALAQEGVICDNAYTQNPICTPSRMSMLSGQYVHNFGYYGLMGKNPTWLPNIFSHVKNLGYNTGAAGKTHTPAGWLSDSCDCVGDGYGFEIPVGPWNEHLQEGLQGLIYNEYFQFLHQHGVSDQRADKVVSELYDKCGHDQGQGVDSRYSELHEDMTIEAWSADYANRFIEKSVAEDKPFCFWLSMPHPHQAYLPAKKFWDMYDGVDIELPPNSEDDLAGRSIAAQRKQENQKKGDWILFEPSDWTSSRKRVLKGYYACVTQVDDAVGRVVEKLEELGVKDDTIIVYLADHGEFAGEHGIVEKAPGIGFKCVTQIPMIWSYGKKLKQGVRTDAMIESVDMLSTICSLADLPKPNWSDGIDQTTAMNTGDSLKTYAFTEHPITKTIHSKQYKFTQYLPEFHDGKEFGELYDTINDPWELDNLYFKDEYQSIVQSMRYELYCWLVRTTRNVTVNPTVQDLSSANDLFGGYSWDLAERRGWCGADGKVGTDYVQGLIDNGFLNYI